MDYEKKYKEALERAKKWYYAPNADKIPTYANKIITEIFPELKEDEDERISKEIIKYLERTVPHHHRDEVLKSKEWTAWLEKQSKRKTWSEEDEHRIKLLEALCEDKLCESVPNSTMYEEMKITIDWINSIKERIGE